MSSNKKETNKLNSLKFWIFCKLKCLCFSVIKPMKPKYSTWGWDEPQMMEGWQFYIHYKTERLPHQNKNDLLSTLRRNGKSFEINVIKDSSLCDCICHHTEY